MNSSRERTGLSWATSLLLLAPAVVLLSAAGIVGPESDIGVGLMLAGGSYLVLDLTVLQPWLARAPGERCIVLAARIGWYHDQLALGAGPDDIPALLAGLAHEFGNARRSFLILRQSMEIVAIHVSPGIEAMAIDKDLVDWASSQTRVLYADGTKTDSATARLFAQTACRVALPLRSGRRSFGVALIAGHARRFPMMRHAHDSLRIVTSLGLQRRRLGDGIHSGAQLQSLVDYARAAQEALMPDERVNHSEGFLIHGMFRPAAACGGDLWVWRSLGHGRVLVVLGDVTGHGVAPAMLSAAAAGAIQSFAIAAADQLDPAALFREVNRSLYRLARKKYMMTAFAAVVDREAGEVRYSNAGQNFPYLVRKSSESSPSATPHARGRVTVAALLGAGPMLGHDADARFTCERVPLMAGDRLVLYTDGIVEASATPRGLFGSRRLHAQLESLAHERADQVAPRLLDAVFQFMGNAEPADDMTVAVVEWPRNVAES